MFGRRFTATLKKLFYITVGIIVATALYYVYTKGSFTISVYHFIWLLWGMVVLVAAVIADKD
jgi:hypothetical protein